MQGRGRKWIVLLQSSSLVTSFIRGLGSQSGGLKGVMREEECGRGM